MWVVSCEVVVLGGGKEVGRSCLLLKVGDTRLLLDVGVKVNAKDAEEHLPLLEDYRSELELLDAVVVTHAHLDHVGALPYLVRMLGRRRVPVLCTAPTRDLVPIMCNDYLRHTRFRVYSSSDVIRALRRVRPVNYFESVRIKSVRVTLIPAGHLLGSAQVLIEADGKRIVYTGDVNFRGSLSLDPAERVGADVVIVESTYGNRVHESLEEAVARFGDVIKRVVDVGGVVLVPVFAVGRGQEILTALHMVKERVGEVPLFVDGMVRDCTRVYYKYLDLVTQKCREALEDPWIRDEILHGRVFSRETIARATGVVISTSGMLLGPALEFFRLIAGDPRNAVMFVSYQAPSTPGYLASQKYDRVMIDGELIHVRCRVEVISGFSGHSDYRDILEYLNEVSPEVCVFVHGDEDAISELEASAAEILQKGLLISPKTGEELTV